MATKYEYYDTGQDTSYHLYGAKWAAQTFNPVIAHKITSVKLWINRVNTPEAYVLHVQIKAAPASVPAGPVLASGSRPGWDIVEGAYSFHEISLGAGCDLDADKLYAIEVYYTSVSSLYYIHWGADGSSPTYTRGHWCESANSGSDWSLSIPRDFLFEDWGEPLPAVGLENKSAGMAAKMMAGKLI